jgi:hypothetical protein
MGSAVVAPPRSGKSSESKHQLGNVELNGWPTDIQNKDGRGNEQVTRAACPQRVRSQIELIKRVSGPSNAHVGGQKSVYPLMYYVTTPISTK